MINQLIASALFGVIAFWGAFQLYPIIFPALPVERASLSLEDTIEQVKRELMEIAATPGQTAGLVLSTVQLELSTQRKNEEGSDVALVVPVFDEAKLTSSEVTEFTQGSKITVSFVAPAGDLLLAESTRGTLDLSALVLAARQALLAAAQNGPEIVPKSVKIELNFVLVATETLGVEVKAYVIEVGVKSEQVETAGNKIVLEYVNPSFVEENKDTSRRNAVAPL